MQPRPFQEYTQKSGVTTYHRDVVTSGEDIVIILLCVTTSTWNKYLITVWRVNRKGTLTRRQPVRCMWTSHRRTFFGEGRRGIQPGSFVYFAKACGESTRKRWFARAIRVFRPESERDMLGKTQGHGLQMECECLRMWVCQSSSIWECQCLRVRVSWSTSVSECECLGVRVSWSANVSVCKCLGVRLPRGASVSHCQCLGIKCLRVRGSWSASVSKCKCLGMQVFHSATVSKCIRFSPLYRKLKLRVICRSSIILGCVFNFYILRLCCWNVHRAKFKLHRVRCVEVEFTSTPRLPKTNPTRPDWQPSWPEDQKRPFFFLLQIQTTTVFQGNSAIKM